ncbi:MAG: TrmH family RNA methyltransferase [Sedimenticolaceae bacterium]|nr:TrmH family RNA methyltransferase [Sedimenticolaceae bacterium]
MIDRPRLSPAERREKRNQALRRYEKERRQNLLASPGPHKMIFVLDHLKAGFNVPKIFRSAESFGAQEIHLINIPPFDPAPAKGGFRKVPAHFHDSFADCYRELDARGYRFFTLEPGCANRLDQAELPEKSAFVMGHEELGISFEASDFGIDCLTIRQFGDTRSLNVSIAASIVMYEYVRQHA